MLRRDAVGERHCFIKIAHRDDRAVIAPAWASDCASFEGSELRVDLGGNRLPEGRIRRDEDRLRAFIMLGLAQQVCCDPGRIVVGVCNNEDLGRARDHVDSYLPKHPPLGCRDKGVARPGDLVDRRNRFGPISQSRHGLRATDAVDLIDACDPRRHQHEGVDRPIGRGRCDHKTLYPRHFCWDRIHQHRGRIGRQPARHVEPGSRNGRPAPPELCPAGIRPPRIFRQLF